VSQIEVGKSVAYAALGSPAGNITVSKVVAYILLIPGEGEDDSNRQGHVHTQIIKRS
jgi:hypothetical protein